MLTSVFVKHVGKGNKLYINEVVANNLASVDLATTDVAVGGSLSRGAFRPCRPGCSTHILRSSSRVDCLTCTIV